MKKHAVHALFDIRLAQCTKPFNARGGDVVRCPQCRINEQYCMCDQRPSTESKAGFLILYYDDEILKPSNTGKLIADLIDETHAFIWKRTEAEPALLALLSDEQWQPYVVFPQEYAEPGREIAKLPLRLVSEKRPLFIMLDGSWREAKKMFRKSPYLDRFPVVSIQPETVSRYQVRKASRDHQLATAEVAACVLAELGEQFNADLMHTWFDLFSYRYQQGVMRKNQGDATAEARLRNLLKTRTD